MNPVSLKEAQQTFSSISRLVSGTKKTRTVICPPFTFLAKLKKPSSKVFLGAQDAFWQDRGAYTGEISAEMLNSLGAKYVILGHSERRTLGETNKEVNKKIKASLKAGLVPIVCVGEKERDERHEYFNEVRNQLEGCLSGIPKDLISKMIIAYEPVWSISTTAKHRSAKPSDFKEMDIYIRKVLSDKFGSKTKMPHTIYGGSVSPKNAQGFLLEGTEGFLVGKESLNPKNFAEIIRLAENA